MAGNRAETYSTQWNLIIRTQLWTTVHYLHYFMTLTVTLPLLIYRYCSSPCKIRIQSCELWQRQTPHHDMPMHAQKRERGVAPDHSKPGTRRWVASNTLRQLNPSPTELETGWTSRPVRTARKISPPPEFHPRTAKPVTCHYTNYASRQSIMTNTVLIVRLSF